MCSRRVIECGKGLEVNNNYQIIRPYSYFSEGGTDCIEF